VHSKAPPHKRVATLGELEVLGMARGGDGDAFWVHQDRGRLSSHMDPQPEGGCMTFTYNQI